ncbi:hypothetical protein DSO57_1006288 [Entomophthora muscae]|uniref:Uncharacterized protein n=1 Tax=Entomophthora muscae TaxID=34485 RepID=A0ACC2SKN9_9FUNG|nr:hypothetical protein DSO57_1006288 [Entomophthora muscae]
MALDAYFPLFSQLVFFGRPLQVAIPVLHWMASWWLIPPGWEPDFVSLAPSLTPPFDVSNNMDQSEGNIELLVLSPN